MRRRFDLTPLGHPIWWGALALLLVNDDLLKGRGVVPGWLTGKLSDFTFLVVAPVVFATLIPRRVPGRRTFATAAVVGLYVAADLSRAVSDAVVVLAARLGLSWRLWPDPTDLVALAVLPVTIWLLRRRPAPADDGAATRRARVRRERAGVVLGAIACIATSAPPRYEQHPFMHNRTSGDVGVRITWVLRKVDCSTTPVALAATLGPSDLDDARTMTLRSGDVAALDGPPAPGASAVGVCSTRKSYPYSYGSSVCVAAIVEADGAQPVLMVTPQEWFLSADGAMVCPAPPPVSECAAHLDPARRLGTDTLGISNDGGALRFEVSHAGRTEQGPADSSIQIEPVDPAAIAARPPAADACRETRDAYRALLQASTACTSNADCTTLPAPPIPGETASCAIYVNKSASPASFAALGAQWDGMCVSATDGCVAASTPVCRAGACADPCAGLALPMCPAACGVDYASMSAKTPCQAAFSCQQSDGLVCTCEAGYLSCKSPPLVDQRCPIGCLPAIPNQHRSTPPIYVPDAGPIDPDGTPPPQNVDAGPNASSSDTGGLGDAGDAASGDARDGAGQ